MKLQESLERFIKKYLTEVRFATVVNELLYSTTGAWLLACPLGFLSPSLEHDLLQKDSGKRSIPDLLRKIMPKFQPKLSEPLIVKADVFNEEMVMILPNYDSNPTYIDRCFLPIIFSHNQIFKHGMGRCLYSAESESLFSFCMEKTVPLFDYAPISFGDFASEELRIGDEMVFPKSKVFLINGFKFVVPRETQLSRTPLGLWQLSYGKNNILIAKTTVRKNAVEITQSTS